MAGRWKRHCQGRGEKGREGGEKVLDVPREGVEQVHQSSEEKPDTVGPLHRLGLGKVGKILGKSDWA